MGKARVKLRTTEAGYTALALAVLVGATLVAVKFAGRARAAPSSRDDVGKYYPRLMQRWQVFGPLRVQGNTAEYAISLRHPGKRPYLRIGRRKDFVPAIRTQLVLPAGVKLLRRGRHKSLFSDRLWRSRWHRPIPETNLRWSIIHGVPTWKALKVGPSAPRVAFWVSGQPGQCFQTKSIGMYRRSRHWKRIPSTLVQRATTCFPLRGGLPAPKWTNVIDDQFNSGGIPSHWALYHSPYKSAPNNCTDPAHDFVSDGYLNIVESYESSKPVGVTCPYGAGWYTGGLTLPNTPPYSANDQRVTLRFRIVSTGGVVPHYIIPMRRADNSEEDFFESDVLNHAHTFLHSAYGRIRSTPAYSVDVSEWHTVRFTQLNHVVSAYIDNMTTPVWVHDGNDATTPDASLWRHVLLQEECSHAKGCPTGTTGGSDIEVDWISVDDAS